MRSNGVEGASAKRVWEGKDESKTTAAMDRHDLHPCRSEVYWQIRRRQARRRHYSAESNRSLRGVDGVVVVAYIRANGLSVETGEGEHEERAEDSDSSQSACRH